MNRIAAIDIGSQTIRLLIADYDSESLYPIERKQEIVRLGSGMGTKACMLPDRIEHAAACVKKFSDHARKHGASKILAVATACVRRAHNSHDFIEQVRQSSGFKPDIISERQESDLSLAGVQAVMPQDSGETVIIDIGGGSTEFSFLTSGCLKHSCSLPLGVIAPTECFMRTDPPVKAEINAVQVWAKTIISQHSKQLPVAQAGKPPAIIVTAGTATTLAAMDLNLHDYAPARINGYMLSLAAVNALLDDMIKLPRMQRAEIPGLEPGRASVIIPGALILQLLLNYFGSHGCAVSDAGLLEGTIIRHASLKKIIEKT